MSTSEQSSFQSVREYSSEEKTYEGQTDFVSRQVSFRQLYDIAYLVEFEGQKLKKPIKVEITYEADGYLAFCEELNLFGTGDTITASIKELQYQLKSHYSELKNTTPGQLYEDAKRFVAKVDALLSKK